MLEGETYTVHIGSNLDVLPTLEDNSIDSIVTDPPYELGFMGKKWDSSGIAYSVELWKECLRVLKPGGHLLSFGGTRTWHRVAVAIEDSGFEVRDSIAWMYGSGFPKSLDVSKAIDKRGGVTAEQSQFAKALQDAKNKTKLSIADLNEVLGKRTSNLWSHFVGKVQPQLPSSSNYWKLKAVLPIADDWDYLFQEEAEREVIGSKMSGIANKEEKDRHTIGASKSIEVDITAPATPEAKQWEGWGTALKPAFEPIVVARKPLIGTVAANVLEHGTGALNIDGSRIGTKRTITNHTIRPSGDSVVGNGAKATGEQSLNPEGRWPANVILDEYSAGILDEQSDASRFFYVAKASKRDRNEGLEELEDGDTPYRSHRPNFENTKGIETPFAGAGRSGKNLKNFHPTVKPTDLMRYLIKLVTPPNGIVLDPFTGSGSTGKAAILEGFRFVGIELTEDYIPIIEGRLKHAEQLKAEQQDKEKEQLF